MILYFMLKLLLFLQKNYNLFKNTFNAKVKCYIIMTNIGNVDLHIYNHFITFNQSILYFVKMNEHIL